MKRHLIYLANRKIPSKNTTTAQQRTMTKSSRSGSEKPAVFMISSPPLPKITAKPVPKSTGTAPGDKRGDCKTPQLGVLYIYGSSQETHRKGSNVIWWKPRANLVGGNGYPVNQWERWGKACCQILDFQNYCSSF